MTTPFWFLKNMEERKVDKQNPGDPRMAAPAPRRKGDRAEEKPCGPSSDRGGVGMIIAGGGTGGHLFPGIAIAEEFLRRDPANRVLFIGTNRGLEKRILGGLGFTLETINVE